MALEERLKQRLIGAAVLVALVVIFVPMLIDEPIDSKLVSDHKIPEKPPEIERSMPEILPPVPDSGAGVTAMVSEKPPVETRPALTESPSDGAPAKPERKSPSAWIIQVASLSVHENAKKLVADLKKRDMPAQLDQVEVEGKRLYRVRVGPEVNFKTAERMAARIKREFKLTPKVMRYPE